MESEFFLNTTPPLQQLQEQQKSLFSLPLQHLELTNSPMQTWQHQQHSLASNTNQSPGTTDCFWAKSTDRQGLDIDPTYNFSSECFMIRELIGKLGNNGSYNNNNPNFVTSNANTCKASTNTSCYSTPLSSPKLGLPITENFPKPVALNSSVAEFSADPGFAERAAKFSSFGSRSFNGRTSQFGINGVAYNRSNDHNNNNSVMGNGKMSRVSSTPALKVIGSQKGNRNSAVQDQQQQPNSSQEESSLSDQPIPGNDQLINSRKRKSVSRGKAKETLPNATKDCETNDDSNAKRIKPDEGNGNGNGSVKAEEDSKDGNSDDENRNKANSKPPEPPKDYIHVRARRGQATDSHSLAERVRREKISERMKFLQDLVPGCNKVTGKALMLDEIINYVQSLQRQVEFLSMKLSSVNTWLDSTNIDSFNSKDVFQSSNNPMQHPRFPLDSPAQAILGRQPLHNISNGTLTHCPVDPLDPITTTTNVLFQMQLPKIDGINHGLPQYPSSFSEDDLHTIVQMGFGQNPNQTPDASQSFSGLNQISNMKNEI